MRFAIRRLLADSRLTITAVLTLALGVASVVVIADTLDRLLIRPPAHVADPDRVTRAYIGFRSGFTATISYETFEALERSLDAEVEHIAAYFTVQHTLDRGADARQVEVVAHSPGYFNSLGVTPQLGALVNAAPGEAPPAVISDALWHRRFGGAEDVLGRPLSLGTEIYTIAAVLPPGFAGIDFTAADIWVPLAVQAPTSYGPAWWSQPIWFLNVIARLAPGVDREVASEHATAVFVVESDDPRAGEGRLVFGDLNRSPEMSDDMRVALWIGGVSLVVLLIACGNVANLLFVRGLRRMHEMTVKVALGATRPRLMREVLVDAALLSAVAGLAAFAIVVNAGTAVRRLFLPTAAALVSPLDTRLIVLTAAVTIGAAFLLGLLPALRLTASRVSAPGQAPPRPSRLLEVFTGAQFALSVPLLVGAGLFVMSLLNAIEQDFGFDVRRVAVVTTSLYEIGEGDRNAAAHRAMHADLFAMPEVEIAAVVQREPWRDGFGGYRLTVPDHELPPNRFFPMDAVDPAFFEVMRLALVEGRFFTDAENREDAAPVAVVSEAMAREIWPGESALGRCLLIQGQSGQADPPCTRIVGVVGDARWSPIIRPSARRDPIYFVPLEQHPSLSSRRAILVRTAGDTRALVPRLRERIHASGRALPYVEIRPFDEAFQPLLRPWRVGATVFVVFGLLALAIAAVGVIVVTSDAVTRRSHELAIRAACGARPGELVRLVLSRSIGAMLAGLTIGAAGAYAGARLLEALLFDVAAADLRIFGAAIAALLGCALIAAWLPARRAGRVDPVVALRAE